MSIIPGNVEYEKAKSVPADERTEKEQQLIDDYVEQLVTEVVAEVDPLVLIAFSVKKLKEIASRDELKDCHTFRSMLEGTCQIIEAAVMNAVNIEETLS